MSDKELIKQEIERIIEEETPISKGSDYYHGAKESMEKLLQFIDSLPEKSGCEIDFTAKDEDLDEAAKHYLYGAILYDDVYVGNPTEEDCIRCFKAGAEWQRKKDESRRNANIALANTDVPKDKDLEIAFEDIWSDVENCVYDLNKLSNEQKYKLKNAHHDTFEAGVIWHKQQIIKDAVDVIFLQDYAYKTPILYGNLKDKMNIVSGQTIKLYQIKKEQQ